MSKYRDRPILSNWREEIRADGLQRWPVDIASVFCFAIFLAVIVIIFE